METDRSGGGGGLLGGLDFSAPASAAPVAAAADDSTGGGMLGGFDFSTMGAGARTDDPHCVCKSQSCMFSTEEAMSVAAETTQAEPEPESERALVR